MLRPIAAKTKESAYGENASWRGVLMRSMFFFLSSSADSFPAAHDALGSDQQDHDEEHQRAGVLEVGGDEELRQVDEDADDQAAYKGAPDRAESADAGRREEQQQD